MSVPRTGFFLSLVVLVGIPLTACGASQDPSASTESIVVFAAASLKQSFTEIGHRFEAENPGATVEFSFAGSSELVTQLEHGAAADVFASADTTSMDKALRAGLIAGRPVNFASNTLTIAVAPGNPKHINSFRELADAGLSVVVCAPQVPCGSATQKVERAAGVQLEPVSEESSVSEVLSKVTTGQADAGLVYVTDVLGSGGRAAGVWFPESVGVVNTYPIAALAQSRNAVFAGKFVAMVSGPVGGEVLAKAGFGKG
ncbi:MAG: molybdate ABC transporter substrate-binding protein [Mycobacterium sp.]